MEVLKKLKKELKYNNVNNFLISYHCNEDDKSLMSFLDDLKNIKDLKRYLKRVLNNTNKEKDFLVLRNKFLILINVFGEDGVKEIGIQYFSEDTSLQEHYFTLYYYFVRKKYSNINKKFLRWCYSKDNYKHVNYI
jgi:hypothetical protein